MAVLLETSLAPQDPSQPWVNPPKNSASPGAVTGAPPAPMRKMRFWPDAEPQSAVVAGSSVCFEAAAENSVTQASLTTRAAKVLTFSAIRSRAQVKFGLRHASCRRARAVFRRAARNVCTLFRRRFLGLESAADPFSLCWPRSCKAVGGGLFGCTPCSHRGSETTSH